MLFTTVEVRWFRCGEVPEPLRDWFLEERAHVTEEPPRVDHYLLVTATDGLGIKYREGRMEVKQRSAAPRVVSFGGGAVGTVARWRKWSFPLAAAVEARETLDAHGAWWAVKKSRLLRDYRIDVDGAIIPVSESNGPEARCSVELSQVEVIGQRWWTLGFEASGPPATLSESLERVTRYILRRMATALDASSGSSGADFLGRDISFGYPRWLQELAEST